MVGSHTGFAMCPRVFAFGTFLMLSGPVLAGRGTWTSGGGRGDISGFAVAPSSPNVVYVATSTGNVFRSIDAGKSWSATAVGPSPATGSISIGLPAVDASSR